jgi:hypothetical protein
MPTRYLREFFAEKEILEVTWDDVYPYLDCTWAQSITAFIGSRGPRNRLRGLVQGGQRPWSAVEKLAADHGKDWRSVSLAALYLYGVSLKRHGDYVQTTTQEPRFLTELIGRHDARQLSVAARLARGG